MPSKPRRPTSSPTTGTLDAATAVLEGAGDGLAEGIGTHGIDHRLPRLAGDGATIAQRGSRSERLRARLDRAEEKVADAIEGTRGKARAVAEAARRARTVPPAVAKDLGQAVRSYAGGLGAMLGYYAVAGLVGAVTLVLVTVGLVQAGERAWGEPWGALAVALGYGILALVLAVSAKGRAARGRAKARERVEVAKAEMRHVTEPLRSAFGSHGSAGPAPPSAANPGSFSSAATGPLVDDDPELGDPSPPRM